MNPKALREALGSFATGVAIVTTAGEGSEYVGMTINSFNSVSLDPPLILWSIDKRAYSFDTFNECQYFAVHILSDQQEDLSQRFARQGADKFEGIECQHGVGGIPLIPDCLTYFQCEIAHRYQGGDHLIIVGRVIEFETLEGKHVHEMILKFK